MSKTNIHTKAMLDLVSSLDLEDAAERRGLFSDSDSNDLSDVSDMDLIDEMEARGKWFNDENDAIQFLWERCNCPRWLINLLRSWSLNRMSLADELQIVSILIHL